MIKNKEEDIIIPMLFYFLCNIIDEKDAVET